MLLSGCERLKMGNTEMPMDEILLEATQFVARCYGCASSESMSVTRYDVWIGKTSKRKVIGAPKLKSLPPTPEAFEQNVRRAHFQVSVWKAALEKGPPELAPTNFGCEKDEASSSLLPVMGHIGSFSAVTIQSTLIPGVQIQACRNVSCIVACTSPLKTNTRYRRLGRTLDFNGVFAIKAYA